jgi:hypothetical protein
MARHQPRDAAARPTERYRLEHEFDYEPDYIFRSDAGEDAEPLITVAPGNWELAARIAAFLNRDDTTEEWRD